MNERNYIKNVRAFETRKQKWRKQEHSVGKRKKNEVLFLLHESR